MNTFISSYSKMKSGTGASGLSFKENSSRHPTQGVAGSRQPT
jgi:hypothetical protein